MFSSRPRNSSSRAVGVSGARPDGTRTPPTHPQARTANRLWPARPIDEAPLAAGNDNAETLEAEILDRDPFEGDDDRAFAWILKCHKIETGIRKVMRQRAERSSAGVDADDEPEPDLDF